MTITVWKNGDTVMLHQLSDDLADGTAQEQIAYLATLEVFSGYACVSEDYTGAAPDTDPALWRWDGSSITSVAPPESPSPAPAPSQITALLQEMGLNAQQAAEFLRVASTL